MDEKLTSTDTMNEEMDDRCDRKLQTTTASLSPTVNIKDQTENISIKDSELSSTDAPVNVFPHKIPETPICGLCTVEKDQPEPHCPLQASSAKACTVVEVSQSYTSTSRGHESLKTTTHTEPEREDLCAAVLLACLFCHPLDCLLATLRGCNSCIWALCSSICGCEPTTLQPLLDVTHHCDPCGCLGARCFLCDCPVCDICLQATECLDLAMEISQMLYH